MSAPILTQKQKKEVDEEIKKFADEEMKLFFNIFLKSSETQAKFKEIFKNCIISKEIFIYLNKTNDTINDYYLDFITEQIIKKYEGYLPQLFGIKSEDKSKIKKQIELHLRFSKINEHSLGKLIHDLICKKIIDFIDGELFKNKEIKDFLSYLEKLVDLKSSFIKPVNKFIENFVIKKDHFQKTIQKQKQKTHLLEAILAAYDILNPIEGNSTPFYTHINGILKSLFEITKFSMDKQLIDTELLPILEKLTEDKTDVLFKALILLCISGAKGVLKNSEQITMTGKVREPTYNKLKQTVTDSKIGQLIGEQLFNYFLKPMNLLKMMENFKKSYDNFIEEPIDKKKPYKYLHHLHCLINEGKNYIVLKDKKIVLVNKTEPDAESCDKDLKQILKKILQEPFELIQKHISADDYLCKIQSQTSTISMVKEIYRKYVSEHYFGFITSANAMFSGLTSNNLFKFVASIEEIVKEFITDEKELQKFIKSICQSYSKKEKGGELTTVDCLEIKLINVLKSKIKRLLKEKNTEQFIDDCEKFFQNEKNKELYLEYNKLKTKYKELTELFNTVFKNIQTIFLEYEKLKKKRSIQKITQLKKILKENYKSKDKSLINFEQLHSTKSVKIKSISFTKIDTENEEGIQNTLKSFENLFVSTLYKIITKIEQKFKTNETLVKYITILNTVKKIFFETNKEKNATYFQKKGFQLSLLERFGLSIFFKAGKIKKFFEELFIIISNRFDSFYCYNYKNNDNDLSVFLITLISSIQKIDNFKTLIALLNIYGEKILNSKTYLNNLIELFIMSETIDETTVPEIKLNPFDIKIDKSNLENSLYDLTTDDKKKAFFTLYDNFIKLLNDVILKINTESPYTTPKKNNNQILQKILQKIKLILPIISDFLKINFPPEQKVARGGRRKTVSKRKSKKKYRR